MPKRFSHLARRLPGRRQRDRRKGISVVWVVVVLPVFLVLLCLLVNTANLWLARVELENAMEASALAAVKQWGDAGGGSTEIPREVGVEYAYLNTYRSIPTNISTNYDSAAEDDNPNENLDCAVGMADIDNGIPPSGNLIFGSMLASAPGAFDASVAGKLPSADDEDSDSGMPAVRAQATVTVPILLGRFFGFNDDTYSVSAKATAAYDRETGRVYLIRVDEFLCP
jgi:hypothetical protein